MPATPTEPGWHDDPEGRRRWWTGTHWGAYAPWADADEPEGSQRPPQQRPTLDRSLTFDPTAGGRASRALGEQPERPTGPLPRPAAGGSSPAPIRPDREAAAAGRSRRLVTATVLLLTLGLLGGHRYYLGRIGSGIAQMMLSFGAAAALVVLQDEGSSRLLLAAVPVAALGWWVVDLIRIRSIVRRSPA
ncbi:NINE protein [Agrococcus carbonis]|uniref:TM2 domain-containing protein n=1 Tax=Agrococcus carbonis TaxID=684552 RepID=A0A1H1N5H2_9MICO|nr:NINE protein [Agrococcus carbonis]SDR93975.1 TM2 domain-containing protein [Agrococcus carbonis]